MTELYLIAHKVRGKPTFDIAHKMEVEDETWWITTTYGHRAYPYDVWRISKLKDVCECPYENLEDALNYMPADCPEHFEVSAAPKGTGLKLGRGVLERLGLLKPQEPMTRRDW